MNHYRIGCCLVAAIASTAALGHSQQAQTYVVSQVSDGGVISGTVTVTGKVPPPAELAITKDEEVCGQESKFDESLLVARETGGLKNAVVWLSDINQGKGWEARTEPRAVDQEGCRFDPHVLIVPVGETFYWLNSDGILHNVHTRSSENRPINKAQPKFLKRLKARLSRPEIVRVDCDAHDWMRAWVVAAAHPYYALTDETGRYRLDAVPPGTYTLTLWHETLGSRSRQVVVSAGEQLRVDVEYPPR